SSYNLALTEYKNNERRRLLASLALLPADPRKRDYLFQRLLSAVGEEYDVILAALLPYKAEMSERLWYSLDVYRDLQAACALARYAPDDPRWEKVSSRVASLLVHDTNRLLLSDRLEQLQPVARFLLPGLQLLLKDDKHRDRDLIVVVYMRLATEPYTFPA